MKKRKVEKIKKYAKTDKIRLSKVNIRMCIWACFQRCKLILDGYNSIKYGT